MPWFRVDDGFYSHPKVTATSLAARGLWVTAGAWSAHHMTDGLVPTSALSLLQSSEAEARELVSAGLWEKTEDGYRFHEWHGDRKNGSTRNPSRKEVLDLRKKRALAGQKGGENSGQARRKQPVRDRPTPKQRPSKSEASASGLLGECLNPHAVPRPLESPPTNLERDSQAWSDGPTPAGFVSDDGRRATLLDLQPDTPVNRWLVAYQNHRPGAGHPLRDMVPEEMADVRMRVEDLVAGGEAEALALLAGVFTDKPRPTSVKQAVLFCRKADEKKTGRRDGAAGWDSKAWLRKMEAKEGKT